MEINKIKTPYGALSWAYLRNLIDQDEARTRRGNVTVELTPDQVAEIDAALMTKIAGLKKGLYGTSCRAEGISIPKWILDCEDIRQLLNDAKEDEYVR